jgi:hypothetical protein
MRWLGYVVRMGRRGTYDFSGKVRRKKKKASRRTRLGGSIILNWISGRYDGVVWTGLIWVSISS